MIGKVKWETSTHCEGGQSVIKEMIRACPAETAALQATKSFDQPSTLLEQTRRAVSLKEAGRRREENNTILEWKVANYLTLMIRVASRIS